MFMEASIFGVVALFIAKFGTVIIAAHQAAVGLYFIALYGAAQFFNGADDFSWGRSRCQTF